MMHSMMNRIYILLDERWQGTSLPEAAEAVRAYRGYGFDTDLWIIESGDRLTDAGIDWSERDTLCVADSARLLEELLSCGAAYCAFSHAGNRGEDLHAADYVLMELPWVDRDSLVKIWQRQRDLPWTILETDRCIVREFVPEDLDAIYDLYDSEARRFLEAPCSDRNKEREILRSYIRRVYRLGGYGDWAVISKILISLLLIPRLHIGSVIRIPAPLGLAGPGNCERSRRGYPGIWLHNAGICCDRGRRGRL